jgi:GntR family transcriptional regulator, arabinose operon transcriptional repressor
MSFVATGPKAKSVHDYVLRQVGTGLLKRGDSLPSEADLARTLGVGRYSVRQAMAELSQSGVVRRVKKKGTFVTLDRMPHIPVQKATGYALMVPEVHSSVFPSLLKGFTRGATDVRQQAVLCETAMDIHVQGDTILRLVQSHVAGVAIVPVPKAMPGYQLEALQAHGTPVVFCHRRTSERPAPLIRWSFEEVGRLAAATLVELGHTQIAFLDLFSTETNRGYIAGMQSALQERGIALPESHRLLGVHSEVAEQARYTEEMANRFLDMPRRPTGVFCGDDYMAERLFLTATLRGLRVPADLSIISFGPTFRDGVLRARLTAVTVDEMEMGRRAAQLLHEMREGRRPLTDGIEVVLPVELLAGASVGPPPKS